MTFSSERWMRPIDDSADPRPMNDEPRKIAMRKETEVLRVDKLDELQRRMREVVRCVSCCSRGFIHG